MDEIFDGHPVLDTWRVVMMAAALWLALLLVRLGWRRRREEKQGVESEAAHWTTYLSYAVAVIYVAFRSGIQLGHSLGEPTFFTTLVVVLGFIGISRRVTFHRPPSIPGGRRHDRKPEQ